MEGTAFIKRIANSHTGPKFAMMSSIQYAPPLGIGESSRNGFLFLAGEIRCLLSEAELD